MLDECCPRCQTVLGRVVAGRYEPVRALALDVRAVLQRELQRHASGQVPEVDADVAFFECPSCDEPLWRCVFRWGTWPPTACAAGPLVATPLAGAQFGPWRIAYVECSRDGDIGRVVFGPVQSLEPPPPHAGLPEDVNRIVRAAAQLVEQGLGRDAVGAVSRVRPR